MTPNALKQGKFGSLGAIFLFIFCRVGVAKRIPMTAFAEHWRLAIGDCAHLSYTPFSARHFTATKPNTGGHLKALSIFSSFF